MNNKTRQYFANDREIYDILMSGKQRLTQSALLEIARRRGIFYSPETSREDLADAISVLPHCYADIMHLLERNELASRAEKTTCVKIDTAVDLKVLKDILVEYGREVGEAERITPLIAGTGRLEINYEYEDIDYSKTRLLQRQTREAEIEVIKEGEQTLIRMSSNPKTKALVAKVIDELGKKEKKVIKTDSIELSHLRKPELRTKFFTDLITSIPNYTTGIVTSLKVAKFSKSTTSLSTDLDIEEEEESREILLAVVQSVLIRGSNLLGSEEYQALRKTGYYAYGVRWQCEQKAEPHHRIRFDVSFEDKDECREMRYSVAYAPRLKKTSQKTLGVKSSEYSNHFKQPSEAERAALFQLIEETARKVLKNIEEQ